MNWFLNSSTGAKLFLSFGLIVLLLAAVLFTAFQTIAGLREAQRQSVEIHQVNVADLAAVESNLNRSRADLLTMFIKPDRADQDALVADIQAYSGQNTTLYAALAERNKADAGLLSKIEETQGLREEYRRVRDTETIPMLLGGKVDEAKALQPMQAERYEKLRTNIEKLRELAGQRAKAAVEASSRQVARAIRTLSGTGAAAVLLSLVMIAVLSRLIATPLKQISAVAARIADGDLTARVTESDRQDEVGILAQNFLRMTGNLRSIMRELLEAVNVLASSAAEIMASTSQLASGAAETATAVAETTATVEEVKQTSQLSSQKAKYVSEQAQKAAEVSQSGKRSVNQTIEGMNGIRQQMSAVAESILALSAQGQSIGEIIATVDDLAAQSKLLAVNAAIEAAKAGDEGKGFGVVAQEVRTLAEQSKQATTQVRGILNDIQKATSSAVLATEQASKAVETGVQQSTTAGESIGALAENVTDTAQAATQIAATSKEQFVGMDQVALAMENIKLASSQTLTSTKQAETAAQQLHELGQKLKQLVERFKV